MGGVRVNRPCRARSGHHRGVDRVHQTRRISMQNVTRRRFLASSSAVGLGLVAGASNIAGAQTPLSFRVSSGMAADQNAAHYLWFQRFSANLASALPGRFKLDYFPDNQLGKE